MIAYEMVKEQLSRLGYLYTPGNPRGLVLSVVEGDEMGPAGPGRLVRLYDPAYDTGAFYDGPKFQGKAGSGRTPRPIRSDLHPCGR